MDRPFPITVPLALTVALFVPGFLRAESRAPTFEHDIRPILKAHCTQCHGEEEKPKGGIDLRLRRFMDKETEDGARVLVAGKPDESELVRVVREGEMPKKGKKLTASELEILERWVTDGARTARTEPASLPPGPLITDEDRARWCYQPITCPPVPHLENASRVRTPIDAFILAKLREQNLDFAPDAPKRILLRRVTLDLTGLLPTPEELDAFLADQSPDAYEKVVDRLLASHAYGERWARHWLDVAGYADSNGYTEADSLRPYAWRYRDYVIRSFNEDKPWNEFVVEQLAGDELAGATQSNTSEVVQDPKKRDDLIATAFLRMAPDGTGDANDDAKLARNQVIAEELKVVSSSLLGLTVGCAQCHDHRYDPIPQADYYRFRAIFEPAFNWENWRPPFQRQYSLYTPEQRAKADEIEKQAKAIDTEAEAMNKKFLDQVFERELARLPEAEREPYRAARNTPEKDRTPEQKLLINRYPKAQVNLSLAVYDKDLHKLYSDKLAEAKKLRATKPPEPMLMGLTEVKGQVPETYLFHRGDYAQPKQLLGPGELTVLEPPEMESFQPASVPSGSSGRRLAYARWLVGGKHPLVARVLVNRFWLHHFGRGIVNSPGDFGTLGELPSHPELLDWLASKFMESGWKLKDLQRMMVLSTVYRQSARNDAALRVDADNRLYGRCKLQRLDAEALRDSMLEAAGTLNREAFGEPVKVARDPGGRTVVGEEKLADTKDVVGIISHGAEDNRRSIYVQVRRKAPLTVLDTFDEPTMSPNCEARRCTTVAPQSLLLMNDDFMLNTAHALASRLREEVPGDARGQVVRAWQILYGRAPKEGDILDSLVYLAEQTEAIRSYDQTSAPAKAGLRVVDGPGSKDAAAKARTPPPPPDPELEALASLCQVFFSSNRFLYVE
ncbi:MAG TPA: PSD1 and planctomycete cytochrome C domain-containing protein [Chthoniobacter sp.]